METRLDRSPKPEEQKSEEPESKSAPASQSRRFLVQPDKQAYSSREEEISRKFESRFHRWYKKNKRYLRSLVPYMVFLFVLAAVSVIVCFAVVMNVSLFAGSDTDSDADETLATETVVMPDEADGHVIFPFFYEGDTIGTISFSSVPISMKAVQGTDGEDLSSTLGHVVDSALPGAAGCSVFRLEDSEVLAQIKTGDPVRLDAVYGILHFTVSDVEVLDAGDVQDFLDSSAGRLAFCAAASGHSEEENAGVTVIVCDLADAEYNT